jgi:hypothetical protein
MVVSVETWKEGRSASFMAVEWSRILYEGGGPRKESIYKIENGIASRCLVKEALTTAGPTKTRYALLTVDFSFKLIIVCEFLIYYQTS